MEFSFDKRGRLEFCGVLALLAAPTHNPTCVRGFCKCEYLSRRLPSPSASNVLKLSRESPHVLRTGVTLWQ